MSEPMTEAQQAAAQALARIHNRRVDIAYELTPEDFAGEALEVLDAVRPVLAAEALAWVASKPERWDGYCCHDHMAGVVMKAAEEITAGLDTVDDEAAEAALEEHRRYELSKLLRTERDLILDRVYDLEAERPRKRRDKGRLQGLEEAAEMLTAAITALRTTNPEETK